MQAASRGRSRAGGAPSSNTGATRFDQRPSGIRAAGELPWGSHFCVFYASPRELLDVLVPFVRAGLESNELCSWELPAALGIEEATRALTKAMPGLARYLSRGQLEIRRPGAKPRGKKDTRTTLESRVDRAILAGFDGLRLVGHAGASPGRRVASCGFEDCGRLNVLAATAYSRAELGALALMEIVQGHRFALVCNSGRWEVLEGSEARIANEALQRSEEKLQSLFRNMSEGFAYHRIVLDARGRPCDYVFLEVSPAFERLTGLVAREILGKRVTQVLPGIEKDPTDWIGKYGKVALAGEPVQFESHAAGLDRWYAVSAFSPHKGFFAVTFSDITDRKRAEALRRAAEERLRVTLRSIGDAVISTDTEGRAVLLNGVAEELTGFSQAEAAGKPLREIFKIVHEETGAPAEDPVREVIERGVVVGLANHTALVHRDGRRTSIADSAAPVRSESGELLGVVLVFRDVTEERKAERALRASEARFKLLSDSASVLLATDNPQGVVSKLCQDMMEHLECHLFLNFLVDPAAGKLRLNAFGGISDAEARRLEWLDFGVAIGGCVATDRQRLVFEEILRSPEPRTGLVRSYGIQAYCCYPLLAEGRVLGTLSFGTKTRARFSDDDLALMKTVADQVAVAMERIQAQVALCTANARLVDSDRRKNDFLATLSHELRNPLAPIKNSLYILDRAAPGGVQARRAQQIIDRQVTHLSSLVNDLLDVTRITRSKIHLQKERLELNEIVRRAVEDNRSFFEKAAVHLRLTPAPRPVHITADCTRVAQIIGNLLQNAAKFTRSGGHTQVSVAAQGGEALVRIADDGVGMTPETLERLFQPFMQAEQTLDRSKGGLGLGLALVKGLIELHGGSIAASSEGIGKGAQFLVRLPADTAPAAEPRPAREVATPARRRILIIEDNVDAADSLREALELTEHAVEVAYDGLEGIEKARQFRPEVVLCDLGLPGMNGYEVARALRADDRLEGAFLVALSGYALAEDLKRAADAGFQRHLAKPPSLDKLTELLDEVLGAGTAA